MCKAKNEVPVVVETKKSGKLFKFIAFVGVCSATAIAINEIMKKQKKMLSDEFEGEQHIQRFSGKEITKEAGEVVPNMRLVSSFGGYYLDLSKASFEADVTFEVKLLWSGLSIRIPDGINVSVDVTGIFGAVQTPNASFEGAPTLFIQGTNRLGGLSVFVKKEEDAAEEVAENIEE